MVASNIPRTRSKCFIQRELTPGTNSNGGLRNIWYAFIMFPHPRPRQRRQYNPKALTEIFFIWVIFSSIFYVLLKGSKGLVRAFCFRCKFEHISLSTLAIFQAIKVWRYRDLLYTSLRYFRGGLHHNNFFTPRIFFFPVKGPE